MILTCSFKPVYVYDCLLQSLHAGQTIDRFSTACFKAYHLTHRNCPTFPTQRHSLPVISSSTLSLIQPQKQFSPHSHYFALLFWSIKCFPLMYHILTFSPNQLNILPKFRDYVQKSHALKPPSHIFLTQGPNSDLFLFF